MKTEAPEADSGSESVEKKTTEREPRVRGKKYKENRAKIDRQRLYELKEAIKLIVDTSYSQFPGTCEMHLVVKKEGLSVNVNLPHSSGVEKKIEIANEKTIKKLEDNNIDFDILIATPDMMPKLVPYARILGPKGLMPNPKNGTLVKSEAEAKKFSLDEMVLRTERKAPLIHTVFGKTDMKQTQLIENAEAIINAVGKRQIVKCAVCATMSPSAKVKIE